MEFRGGGSLHRYGLFDKIISLPNLFSAWGEFKRGKLKKQDVASFSIDVEEYVFGLHRDLIHSEYNHHPYSSFFVCDPKRRKIHKAKVRDRLFHHAIFRVLEHLFDRSFIFDSYSSRTGKGIHKAHERFKKFAWRLSRNNTKTVWVLKCDIRKFFDSVDQKILLTFLAKEIKGRSLDLLRDIISSFETEPGKGIPIGNLTSQLFSNFYLNAFDQFVKRELGVKDYIRYADDFVILSRNKDYLDKILPVISKFLKEDLALELHPNKIIIRKWSQGIDFLGYVIFPYHQILRTKTKNRILRKLENRRQEFDRELISEYSFRQSTNSYLGMLEHCRGRVIKNKIDKITSFDR